MQVAQTPVAVALGPHVPTTFPLVTSLLSFSMTTTRRGHQHYVFLRLTCWLIIGPTIADGGGPGPRLANGLVLFFVLFAASAANCQRRKAGGHQCQLAEKFWSLRSAGRGLAL